MKQFKGRVVTPGEVTAEAVVTQKWIQHAGLAADGTSVRR